MAVKLKYFRFTTEARWHKEVLHVMQGYCFDSLATKQPVK